MLLLFLKVSLSSFYFLLLASFIFYPIVIKEGLHLIVNDRGELLSFQLTAANTDDRKPVPDLTQSIFGKLFGDKGYISKDLFNTKSCLENQV